MVGPNGSGKSNVVDALAWVMGEQGAKSLRGGSMQDVIFAGAGDRKPLGRAEVTLTIDNHDGKLPIEYAEVSLTRRMFRDGASEYEINGSRARLMDVQELLSDSGIGREMHVIVGQGRLAELLDSRPEERRAFIEEAAGVLKHRRRKEKAQRKLAGMQGNLDRLRDLTAELATQLGPLAKQAETAQRAHAIQAEVREARLRLTAHRLVELRSVAQHAAHRSEDLETQRGQAAEEVSRLENECGQLEAELSAAEGTADHTQQLWFRLSTLAERVSGTRRVAQERAAATGSLSGWSGPDPEELEKRARRAEAERDELADAAEEARERLATVREEVADCEENLRDAESEHMAQLRAIADRREGLARLLTSRDSYEEQAATLSEDAERAAAAGRDAHQRVAEAQEEHAVAAARVEELAGREHELREREEQTSGEAAAAESRVEALREKQRRGEATVNRLVSRIETLEAGFPKTAADSVLQGTWRPLRSYVFPDPGFAEAVSAALAAHEEALVGELDEQVAQQLREAQAARTVLVGGRQDPDVPRERDAAVGGWRLAADLPDSAEWLLDHVRLHPSVSEPINRLLADVVWVPDMATARRVVGDDPRLRAVTPQGELVGSGWVQIGCRAPGSVAVAEQIGTAATELEQAKSALAELAGTVEGARQAAEDARMTHAAATVTARDHLAHLNAARRDVERAERALASAQRDAERAQQREIDVETRLRSVHEHLSEVGERLARAGEDTSPEEPSTEERDRAATALEQAKAMEVEARLALRSTEDQLEAATQRAQGLARQASQERVARARHAQEQERCVAKARLAQAVADGAQRVAARVDVALAEATSQRDAAAARRTELNIQVARVREQESAARRRHERAQERAHEADVERGRTQARWEEAQSKAEEQLALPISELLAEHAPEEGFDRAAETRRLKKAERELASLGKVNPLALEEYRALEERHSFLATQLADVEQARRDLEEVIRSVDAQILQLFTDAWLDVEREFPKVFATLFPGGRGELSLTDPDDMLTTGIELAARPPGKRVSRLSLLSGGEKSLTALAFLVAIFRARPSPFYVMDEVEAALDDVNLRRLIALFRELRRDSQLIVITHQKPTMDVANVLYGVTMRGDGVTRVISQRMHPDDLEQAPQPAAPKGPGVRSVAETHETA